MDAITTSSAGLTAAIRREHEATSTAARSALVHALERGRQLGLEPVASRNRHGVQGAAS